MKWISPYKALPALNLEVEWRNGNCDPAIPLGKSTVLDYYKKVGPNIGNHEWLDESESLPQEQPWRFKGMPKDGEPIVRWHRIWKCPVTVTYFEPGTSELCWREKTLCNEWPEDSFTPDAWQPLPAPPTE